MQIAISEFGHDAKKVVLVGKLDISAAEVIELPLATVAGSRANIVVDMTAVDFIASIGIRQLVLAAKTVSRSSRRLVLLSPIPLVADVLVNAGLGELLQIVHSEDEARAAFSAGAA
jgi:anti-anti-sigma factor